jgi:hypothetical protein
MVELLVAKECNDDIVMADFVEHFCLCPINKANLLKHSTVCVSTPVLFNRIELYYHTIDIR